MSLLLVALRELTLDAKYQEASRAYSSGKVLRTLVECFTSSERALDRLRIELRGMPHVWPKERKEQRRYVLRYHFGVAEDLLYAVKAEEAREMFKSRRLMRRYLRGLYGTRQFNAAIISASRFGERKTLSIDGGAAVFA